MKSTIPEQTVNVCDFCQRPQFLQSCHVCGREFCLFHEGTVMGSSGFTTLCVDCVDRDDVKAVCARYAKQLSPIFQAREETLKALDPEGESP